MKLNRGPEGEHGTLGVELTEVSSHSTPSLRNGVDWRARRHTSSRFVEGSGLSPVGWPISAASLSSGWNSQTEPEEQSAKSKLANLASS